MLSLLGLSFLEVSWGFLSAGVSNVGGWGHPPALGTPVVVGGVALWFTCWGFWIAGLGFRALERLRFLGCSLSSEFPGKPPAQDSGNVDALKARALQ